MECGRQRTVFLVRGWGPFGCTKICRCVFVRRKVVLMPSGDKIRLMVAEVPLM